ncbi:hypothetical protein V6N13_113698 [Hibiscus sabdariffa]
MESEGMKAHRVCDSHFEVKLVECYLPPEGLTQTKTWVLVLSVLASLIGLICGEDYGSRPTRRSILPLPKPSKKESNMKGGCVQGNGASKVEAMETSMANFKQKWVETSKLVKALDEARRLVVDSIAEANAKPEVANKEEKNVRTEAKRERDIASKSITETLVTYVWCSRILLELSFLYASFVIISKNNV